MTTAEDYKAIGDEVYFVDPMIENPPRSTGDRFHTAGDKAKQQFVVYDTATDPVTGFQAMAVVPVVDGDPDYSKVFVSYAGTNPGDGADIVADTLSVVGGKSGVGTQVFEARQFAKQVQERLATDGHAGASIETVGHSLGGYLALVVAAENRWPSTTFNGPDPWDALSPRDQRWVEEQLALGRKPLTNYVNEFDVIGNLFGNRTGAAVFVKDSPGKGPLEYHNLSSFVINPDGSITGADGTGLSMDSILENVANTLAPGSAVVLSPILAKVASGLRNPGVAAVVGQGISGLVVAIDTVGAVALAASIASAQSELEAIKAINDGLIPEMVAALTIAKQSAYIHPFISEADIENCVSMHRLQVHHNIDASAVAAVSSLVDDHLVTVWKIYDGVIKTVKNAAAQDAQWALVYSGN